MLPSSRLSQLAAGLVISALSWTTRPVGADMAAGAYFVHKLPGAPAEPVVKMHAGHIEVTPEHNGNLFFWHFQNRHIAQKQRTVIWLNGGPGCSSEDGALMEIGPYRVKDKDTLVYNNGSWNEFANLLFVDNPVGTGYSYVNTDSYVTELDEMARQFIVFLEKWFNLFPEYEHDDIYIAGESYAGQHIPYIARAMLERNKGAKSPWNLRGLLIGNGWISPVDQYEAYLAYAYDRGIVQRGSDMATQLELQFRICRKDLATGGPHVELNQCEKILQDMLQYTATTESDGRQMCYNMYDVRLRDEFPSCGMNWPPDLEFVTPYLRRPDVVEALHVSPNRNTGWTECSGAVGSAFRNPRSPPTITFLPEIIAQVPVVLFSGDQDLLCNHIGTEMLIDRMTWNGGKGFELSPGSKEMAPRRAWTVDGMEAGFWQEARNLTYIRFYNSSHMVPFDYARRTRDMLDRVMGIDVSSIGGEPANSRLDGEKGPPTTVGEHGSGSSNSGNGNGESDEDHAKAVQAAKWAAYRKSGEIVLVLVAVAAAAWGYYVWRERRRASRLGYQGLAGGEGGSPERRGGSQMRRSGGGASAGSALENFRNKRTGRSGRDLEAGDFDESELDDLHVATPTERDDRYSVGGGSDDEDRGMNGRGKENR